MQHKEIWEIMQKVKYRTNLVMRVVQEYRGCDRFTLQDACGEIGTNYNNVRRVLYSDNPTIGRIIALAETIGVTTPWLLYGDISADSIEWRKEEKEAVGERQVLVPIRDEKDIPWPKEVA